MNKYAASPLALSLSPGRLTVIAGLLASLSAPALAESPDIVISQVYGAGGNGSGATVATYKHDFIELFNRGSATVNIGDWSVQYASTGGNSWQVTRIPAGTQLEPGQYFLIRQAAGTAAVPDTPSDLNGSIPMAGAAGKVALSRTIAALSGTKPTSTALVDLVGYGSGTVGFEGDAPTASIGNTSSASRKNNGCQDSDQNGADFSVGAVNPRTTASPRNMCSGEAPAEPIVASCPAGLAVQQGAGATALLSASDKDSIVNNAVIVSGAAPGIALVGLAPAGSVGGTASVNLQVDASVAAGSYPVKVSFTNNDSQEKSCTVAVSVAGQLSIPKIQGSGPASQYAGTVQATEGVVTARLGNSLFVQDPVGDGDPSTSDAIYVFNNNAALVEGIVPGDRVRVSGKIVEYRPSGADRTYTELTEIAPVVKLAGGQSVAPTNIELPNTDLARFEGMLVRFVTDLTVNQNKYLGDRGELTLAYGRRESPTNRHLAGSAEANALAAANAANEIVLDDGIFSAPPVIPYLNEDNTVRAGDTVTNLVGVLDYGSIGGGGAAFKLQPTEAPQFSRTNPRQPAPSLAPGVKVASANVLNFFTTFTNGEDAWGRTGQGCLIGTKAPSAGECRGADNMAEFLRQRNQIVHSLKALDADVVGLMEIQHNGDTAVSYLVDQLNTAIGQPVYQAVLLPAGADRTIAGTDAIRVAMIYKPAVVTPVGSSMFDSDRINNRAPMAQTFKAANGAKFSVVVNHFKSKASCGGAGAGDTELGNGQGCWDETRVKQATRLTDVFLPQVKAAAGDEDVLIIGDLNAYPGERPIQHLVNRGFVNQIERFIRPHGIPYSYVFDGASGYLDHALASTSLSGQVAGAAEWHNNADEPEHIDYNLGDTVPDPYREGAYRASDHDPVLVSLNLTPTWVDASASFSVYRSGLALNRATGQYGGSFQFTNKTSAAITGPFHVKMSGLPADVTLANASGSHNGVPYITAGAASIAPGATVTVNVLFNNPKRVAINYSAAIVAGTF